MLLRASLLALFLLAPAVAAAQGPAPAGCALGEAEAELNVAGVRAGLSNIGGLFWRGSSSTYEVPQGTGLSPMFSTSLMVGGMVGGELRFAGSTYGPWEFWPGPLDTSGATTPETCAAYDRIWVVRTADLRDFDATGVAGAALAAWPVGIGAPFYVDADRDGLQGVGEPTVSLDPGDVGYGPRAIDLAAGERPALFGRQTAWWVMNDAGGAHGWSADAENPVVDPLGIEVRVTAWAHGGEAEPELFESTFYRYEIVNRSRATIRDLHAGFYADADLGDFNDDRVGTDSTRQMLLFYNGDEFDDGGGGYGDTPPAFGIDLLSGASGALPPDKNGVWGEPSGAISGYNYLTGFWRNGDPLTYGGFGRDPDARRTRWAYSGDETAERPLAYWSQENYDGEGSTVVPSDKRGVISALPADLAPGERLTFDAAFLFARLPGRLNSIRALREVSDRAQTLYNAGVLTVPVEDPPPPPTPIPIGPRDEAVEGDAITFAWEPIPDAERYEIEVFSDAEGTDLLFRRPALVPSLSVPNGWFPLNRRTPMSWRVRAVRLGSSSIPSPLQPFAYFVPGFDRFSVLANAAGPLTPPLVRPMGGFSLLEDAERQQTSGAVWNVWFPHGSMRGSGGAAAYPSDYEIRFPLQPSAEDIGLLDSTGVRIRVPFQLWDIGVGTPDDPADDVRLVPIIHDTDGNGAFGLERTPYGYGINTDAVSWVRPVDMAPGQRGYRDGSVETARTLPDSTRLVLPGMWFQLSSGSSADPTPVHPEPGTLIRFESSAQALPVAAPETPDAPVLEIRPNPTAARATVAFRLAAPGPVRLTVVDVLGREVAVLADGDRPEGEHRAALDASRLAPGVYVLVLRSGAEQVVRTMTVAR